jgi:tetratricopeptide (TPR) repeat protein
MDEPIDRRSVEAQAGLTCLACHGISTLHDRTGNGNYVLRASTPELYVFSDATEPGVRRRLHDAALRARPEAHRAAMVSKVARQPEFCGSCHKVSLRDPLNDYRWLRGQNEFDTWENSGVSREGAQTFYLPPNRRVCQDCHMPPEPAPKGDLAAVDGQVRSHRFLAANTALSFIRGDTSTLRRVEEFLQDEIVSVDVFGWHAVDGRRVERALGDRITVRPGLEIELDIVVRNRGAGHSFPGGTLDSNEGWLDVRLLDESGVVVARSGGLDQDGHLDPGAHVYRALFVDTAGRAIDRRNPQDIRALVFVNAVGPGTANLAHYRLKVPGRPGRYTLDARLRWRKFNRAYSEFVFSMVPEAFPGHSSAPALPVTTVARTELRLEVAADAGAASPEHVAGGAPSEADDLRWLRWNDFGIASIREGRTRAAAEAFAQVSALAPDRPDGPINMARVALAEGDVQEALNYVGEAERRAPEDARISWIRAEAHLREGEYGAAAAAYRRTLASFPRHRASLLGLARSLYLDGRLDAALGSLDELLAIDAEARPAWYHRMLVLRALGRTEEADEAEAMVEYFRVDEAAGRLTRRLRSENPGVNAMTQDVRTHALRPVRP